MKHWLPCSRAASPKSKIELPNAQCPMPNAQCPMPNAQYPIPNIARSALTVSTCFFTVGKNCNDVLR
ncbi:hypothetical protein [Nostoc sp. S13]|uniref:hypothetical protein n=1 Tax=Nostoc sp. S13 TaxID=3019266 RepID=UPI0026262399|nr:hypothetical protein [Nostoc sp. S13]